MLLLENHTLKIISLTTVKMCSLHFHFRLLLALFHFVFGCRCHRWRHRIAFLAQPFLRPMWMFGVVDASSRHFWSFHLALVCLRFAHRWSFIFCVAFFFRFKLCFYCAHIFIEEDLLTTGAPFIIMQKRERETTQRTNQRHRQKCRNIKMERKSDDNQIEINEMKKRISMEMQKQWARRDYFVFFRRFD